MSAPAERVDWRDLIRPDLAPRAALVLLGVWLNAADSLVTATLMPSVARSLHAFSGFGLSVAGYLTGAIVAGASAGRLSQRFGLRPAMIVAGGAYSAGCLMSAAAPDLATFVAGRIVQGIGAGWIVGFCYVAVGMVFPERLWLRLFGLMAGVWGVASLTGPLLGGLFAAAGQWRGAFWMFLGQGLVFAAAAAVLVQAADAPETERPTPWRTLLALTLSVGLIAVAGLTPQALAAGACAIAGVALLALAARVNAGPSERLLPAEAGRPATPAGAGYAMTFALSAAGAVVTVYGAAMLQALYGLSPLSAGYVIAAEAMGWTLAAFAVSGAPPAIQPALIRAGAAIIAAAVALVAVSLGRAPLPALIAAIVLQGVGFGLCWSLAARRILTVLPDAERAIGASAVPTAQIIGGATGAAAAGALANLLGLARGFDPASARAAELLLFGAFAPVAALGVVAALRLTKPPQAA